MLKHLIVSLFLLVSFASGQDTAFSIRGFGGLDTRSSDFSISPNMARQAHEIDFGENVGAITKRKGYDSVATLTAVDSIVDIYAAYYSDGTQQLFLIVDDPDSTWGRIYVTNKGSINPDSLTEIYKYWPMQGVTSFAMYGDAVYIASSLAKGIAYSDGRTYTFPMRSPGEPTIVPIPWSTAKLSGEYRYVMRSYLYKTGGTFEASNLSGTYGPISANGAALLTNFWYAPRTINTPDTINWMFIYIFRTRANPGRLDGTDTAFFVGGFTTYGDSLSSAVFIDSIPDASLGGAGHTAFALIGDKRWLGLDSTGAFDSVHYASPGWLNSSDTATYDSTTASGADVTEAFGIYRGMPEQVDTLGVAYAWTVQDTISGFESDTSRSLVIFDTGALSFSNTITLPKPSPADSGLVRNVYRALIYQITYDTGALRDAAIHRDIQAVLQRDNQSFFDPIRGFWDIVNLSKGLGQEYLAVDSIIIADYYLVSRLSWSDTIMTDSLRYDSLRVKRRYSRKLSPPRFSSLLSYKSRLIGTYGSNLYFTALDSAYSWGGLDFISIGRDDGDVITSVYASRNALRVAKNNSLWNAYQDANLSWSLAEISQGFGIVAPRSYARGVGGHYYLTEFGVMRENEGQYLERTQAIELISSPIDNLTNLPISTLRNARGFYHDQKYMLCIGDTTYVYDERANAWSTWGLTFASAVHYGTESDVEFVPGDSMYFIKSGDSVLYRYGATTDNGTQIIMRWKSVPFFVDPIDMQVTGLGLWHKNSAAADTVWAIYYADGQLTSPDTSSFVSLDSRIRYAEVARGARSLGLFFQIGLQQKAASTSQLIIDGLDVYATRNGRRTTY